MMKGRMPSLKAMGPAGSVERFTWRVFIGKNKKLFSYHKKYKKCLYVVCILVFSLDFGMSRYLKIIR